MTSLPTPYAAARIAAFLDDHLPWSAYWDKHYGLWRVAEDDTDSDLYAESRDADAVIGSRWVPDGTVVNWPRSRELLSRSANGYARVMLGIGIRDVTAGYRAYRADTLRKIDLDQVISQGYCFQIDLTLRAITAGLTVTEVPITFTDRTRGASKMSRAVVAEALWRVTQWGAASRLGRDRKARAGIS